MKKVTVYSEKDGNVSAVIHPRLGALALRLGGVGGLFSGLAVARRVQDGGLRNPRLLGLSLGRRVRKVGGCGEASLPHQALGAVEAVQGAAGRLPGEVPPWAFGLVPGDGPAEAAGPGLGPAGARRGLRPGARCAGVPGGLREGRGVGGAAVGARFGRRDVAEGGRIGLGFGGGGGDAHLPYGGQGVQRGVARVLQVGAGVAVVLGAEGGEDAGDVAGVTLEAGPGGSGQLGDFLYAQQPPHAPQDRLLPAVPEVM